MVDNIISDLKNRGLSISEIIAYLKSKDIDPNIGYRILKFYFRDEELEIRKNIIQIYSLNSDYNLGNPFTDDFINKL